MSDTLESIGSVLKNSVPCVFGKSYQTSRVTMPRTKHTRELPVGTVIYIENEVRMLTKAITVEVEERDSTNYSNQRRILTNGHHLAWMNGLDPQEGEFLQDAAPHLPPAAQAAIAVANELRS